jgi:hypothetical protein
VSKWGALSLLFRVMVVGDFCGQAGSRMTEALAQLHEWARARDLREIDIPKAGCSIEHSIIPFSFLLSVESASRDHVTGDVKAWLRNQPIILRAVHVLEQG